MRPRCCPVVKPTAPEETQVGAVIGLHKLAAAGSAGFEFSLLSQLAQAVAHDGEG